MFINILTMNTNPLFYNNNDGTINHFVEDNFEFRCITHVEVINFFGHLKSNSIDPDVVDPKFIA